MQRGAVWFSPAAPRPTRKLPVSRYRGEFDAEEITLYAASGVSKRSGHHEGWRGIAWWLTVFNLED